MSQFPLEQLTRYIKSSNEDRVEHDVVYDFQKFTKRLEPLYSFESKLFTPKREVTNPESIPSTPAEVFKRDVILNERFDSHKNVQAKIVGVNKTNVQCLCLLDADEKIFKQKAFPKSLFNNFPQLEVGNFVLISIKIKPGSMRYDIYPGEQFVDKNLFNQNEDDTELDEIWNSINTKRLMKPMNYRNK